MEREQLDNYCEKGILGLVLVILVYSALAFGGLPQGGFDYFLVVEWLAVVMLLIWLVRFWVNPKHRLLWPPMCWPVLAFVGYAIGRYLTADIEYLARQELIKVLIYAALFYAIVNNLHRQETTQIVGLTLIFLAMALSLFAVYQFLTGFDQVWNIHKPEGYRKRGSATFISPNHLAGYLGMVLPLALTFTLTGRFEPLMKIFLSYASLAIFGGISVTISRAGWLATGVSLFALYFWILRQRDFLRRGLMFLALLLTIFVMFFLKAKLPPERYERFEMAAQVEDVRFKLWPAALQIWKDHLWVGVGPAHFDYRFRQYRAGEVQLQARPDRVHNDYLNTLVDWGLVGAVLVLSCWVAFYYQVFTGWKFVQRGQNDLGAKRSNRSAFVSGGALGLLAILVHSIFDFNMHVPANAIVAVTLLALVGSHYRFASERYWHTVRWPLRLAVNLVLPAALVYLSWQAARHSMESHWLARADIAPEVSAEKLACLKRAWQAEPKNSDTAFQIGETLRSMSSDGGEGHKPLAQEAITWFEQGAALNPYDPNPLLREGMCLHWLGDHGAAAAYFDKAERLDPNSYNTEAYVGWHHFQLEDYTQAKRRFERSIALQPDEKVNPVAFSYLKIVREKLKESGPKP
ncbi:MAG TPA: O-antigen ligase family protein [Verrucomicrobiae bacterium]|nr:O-antigen ligase family protein [Verrucomicrobiae bacterium]